jgi:ABC-type microcin C transport system permease subunit YejB
MKAKKESINFALFDSIFIIITCKSLFLMCLAGLIVFFAGGSMTLLHLLLTNSSENDWRAIR